VRGAHERDGVSDSARSAAIVLPLVVEPLGDALEAFVVESELHEQHVL
jgi:hypothetical protein